MGKDGDRPCALGGACAFLKGAAASNLGKALIATCVVAAANRIKGAGVPGVAKKIKPITKPGDGWVNNLSGAQLAQLADGKRVLLSRRLGSDSGGRGTAVCDIAAPPATVLRAVTNFDRYAGRLAQCSYSKIYEKKKNVVARTETIKAHMKLAGGVKTFNCYYDHTFSPAKGTVTWTLDPDKKSDFLDVQGQWFVSKHPSKKNWSRVWYSADVALPPWLPRMIVVQLCKTSGTKALQFCKKEAESMAKSSWSLPRGGALAPRGRLVNPLRPRALKR